MTEQRPTTRLADVAVLSGFLLLAVTSVAWFAIDRAPLVFDQGTNLSSALYFAEFPGDYLGEERQLYPPLVHALLGLLLRITDYRIDLSIAILDLAFLAVAVASTYGLGRELWSARVGAFACTLLVLYPATFVHSRALLLDLPLMAVTAFAILALVRSRRFTDPGWSVAFGAACAIGLLTKQMFAPAVVLPLGWELLRSPRALPPLRNVALAALPPLVIGGIWYLPRADWFLGDYRAAQVAFARDRGDPTTLSIDGLTYYLRGTWHQMTVVLAAIWLATLPWFWRASGSARWLLLLWWGGVVISCTALPLKDSRFLMPALPAVALMTAAALDRMRNGTYVLGAAILFGVVQLWAASFGSGVLPEGPVVTNLVNGQDVTLFAQHWRLTAADTSVADDSGWGGASEGLRSLRAASVAFVGDRVVPMAIADPRIGAAMNPAGPRVERLTCADAARFRSFDVVILQAGGRFGLDPEELTSCTAGLVEQQRIALSVPRLIAGADALVVYRRAP